MRQWDAAARLGVSQATLCSLHKQRETAMAASRQKLLHMEKSPVVEVAPVK